MARHPFRPQTYQGTCVVCGAEFLTGYPYTMYCGSTCSQRAHVQRTRSRQRLPMALPAAPAPAAPATGIETRAWHGTPIQRRESDGYVNATAMCKANGKHLPHYMANARTEAYIAALAPVVGIPTTALVESRQGGTPSMQGTWIHPRLAVDLARWISPAFAVWMDGWFLDTIAAAPHHHTTNRLPFRLPHAPLVGIEASSQEEAVTIWQEAVIAHYREEVKRLIHDVKPIWVDPRA
jgi:hypothetical protein